MCDHTTHHNQVITFLKCVVYIKQWFVLLIFTKCNQVIMARSLSVPRNLDKGRSWDVHNSAQAWPDLKIIQIEVCFRLTSILVQGAEHDGPLNALLPQRKAHPVIRCKEWKMLKWCLIWIPKHHNCWNVIFLCKSYCTSIR